MIEGITVADYMVERLARQEIIECVGVGRPLVTLTASAAPLATSNMVALSTTTTRAAAVPCARSTACAAAAIQCGGFAGSLACSSSA
jgi:hypothetical protein